MKLAIDETDRRRAKQVEYNTEHGITPQSVVRAIVDQFEGARSEPDEVKGRGKGKARRVAESQTDYAALSPGQLASRIKALEQQMYQHARDLEFEAAANVRDQLRKLKEAGLAG
jgi:excinuclease ABC subunit B